MRSRFVAIVCCMVIVVFGIAAKAEVPHYMNFQGILLDSLGGVVEDGSYDLTFRIYTDSSGGLLLWSEGQQVTTENGLFTVFLGRSNPVPDSVFDQAVRWFEIQLDENAVPYEPRSRIGSVAYAYRVGSIDGAMGGEISSMVFFSFADDDYTAKFENTGDGDGLRALSSTSLGDSWAALFALCSGTGSGIYSTSTGGGKAAYLDGDVVVTGMLHAMGGINKPGGVFKIDHPLDPENMYLSHSFVESPDMKNIYDGVVVLDANGEATVTLPSYFEAENRDFRYQLTCVGGYAPVYIAEEISDNQFRIAGGTPNLKVSWLVTGIRQDAYANAYRIQPEELKTPSERGKYLHPEVFAQPADKGIFHVNRSDLLNKVDR